MSFETEWVSKELYRFKEACAAWSADVSVRVECGRALPYLNEILRYDRSGQAETDQSAYETDLLIFDEHADQSWIPRVIIECKLGSVTTHDALTYSAKAATHKHVHPYLRYGILLGKWGRYPLPPRLVRHGTFFDFMATWIESTPDEWEWDQMRNILSQEIKASRYLQRLQADRRTKSKAALRILHRPLVTHEHAPHDASL
jgi:hypothetical protein